VASAQVQQPQEISMRFAKTRLQAILEQAPASLAVSDLTGRTIVSNRQFLDLSARRGGPDDPPTSLP